MCLVTTTASEVTVIIIYITKIIHKVRWATLVADPGGGGGGSGVRNPPPPQKKDPFRPVLKII